MEVTLDFLSIDVPLPVLQLDATAAFRHTVPAAVVNSMSGNLEMKVVTNAGLLMSASDSNQECSRKLADCMADAVGLMVDFSALGL